MKRTIGITDFVPSTAHPTRFIGLTAKKSSSGRNRRPLSIPQNHELPTSGTPWLLTDSDGEFGAC